MTRLIVCPLALLLATLCCRVSGQEPAAEAAATPVSFSNEIAPIFVKNCLTCHGKNQPKGEYELHTYALAVPDRIEPGKPDDSYLYALLISEDVKERMPKDGDPLPAEQIALIKRWIEEGAAFDGPDPAADLLSIVPKEPLREPPVAYARPVPVTAVAYHPGGTELAVGGYYEITIWNPADGTLLRRIKTGAERVLSLTYNSDGSLLAAALGTPGALGGVKLFNPADGAIVKELAPMPDVAFDVAFSPAGDKLAAAGADRSIRVFDVASGTQDVLIEDHADWVMSIAWSPDGTKLVSASRDKTSKVFDAKTGESQITFPGHAEPVFGAAFSADGAQVFTCGADKKIRVWNPADAAQAAEIGGFGMEVYQVMVAGGQIFSSSADKTAQQHTPGTWAQVRAYSGHSDYVFCVAFHEGTKRLATGSFDGEVRIWNTDDGQTVAAFKAAPGYAPPAQAAAQ